MSAITLAIGDITVRQHNGLFSLNDLHKAAGGEAKHQPALFMRMEQTQALIAEIGNSTDSQSFKTKEGRNGGTYACRELVIAYAAWISAAFHLKVIRVFLAVAAPQPEPIQTALDYDRISPAQAQDLKELVQTIVDAKIQGYGETWARLHRKFRVNSYLELPASRFEEARDYLLGKLPEAPQAAPQLTAFMQSLAAARENALHYFTAVGNGEINPRLGDIPAQALEGIVAEALMASQFLAGFDYRTGQMHVRLVPRSASVFCFQTGDFGQAVNAIPTKRLPELHDALSKRIARHLGALQH